MNYRWSSFCRASHDLGADWFRPEFAKSRAFFRAIRNNWFCISLVLACPGDILAATYTVSNGVDSGTGSLRQAILDANAHPGSTIQFDVPWPIFPLGSVPTVKPTSPLPTVTAPVIIDGTTETNSYIQINGASAGSGAAGLRITAGGCTIKGLVINGFSGDGIELVGPNGGNHIYHNRIGTTYSGTSAASNGGDGVLITNSPNNSIGGTTLFLNDPSVLRNIISGNGGSGINITGDGATNNSVRDDYIGLNAAGAAGLGNQGAGVFITANNNVVGTYSLVVGAGGNVISGNGGAGIDIEGCTNCIIGRNYIGTDASGSAAIGNQDGVFVMGAFVGIAGFHSIGGTDLAPSGNLISGNRGYGIEISGVSAVSDSIVGCSVQANSIGVDHTGVAALGNLQGGIRLDNASSQLVGGTAAGAGNVISGNGGNGLILYQADNNLIQGNQIGTDRSGTVAIGNGADGISILIGNNNLIGGTNAAAANIISANHGNGVSILNQGVPGFATTTCNTLIGNFIGTDTNGSSALGNSQHGIYILDGDNSMIGVAAFQFNALCGSGSLSFDDLGNIIAHNGASGVSINGTNSGFAGTSPVSVQVLANSIFDNGPSNAPALGIDLGDDGVTTNHSAGDNTGPNGWQQFPVLSAAIRIPNGVLVSGTLSSTNNSNFMIQFFANPACSPSGFGQGQMFLGSINVTTDGAGNAAFTATLVKPIPIGQVITATATLEGGLGWRTSEFSACQPVVPVSLSISPLDGNRVLAGCTTPAPGAVLEETPSLNPPVTWTTSAVFGANIWITNLVDPSSPIRFYRLSYP